MIGTSSVRMLFGFLENQKPWSTGAQGMGSVEGIPKPNLGYGAM